jgi:hypothetical protein
MPAGSFNRSYSLDSSLEHERTALELRMQADTAALEEGSHRSRQSSRRSKSDIDKRIDEPFNIGIAAQQVVKITADTSVNTLSAQ